MIELTKKENLIAGLESIIEKLKSGEMEVVDVDQHTFPAAMEYVPLGQKRLIPTKEITEYKFSVKHSPI